MVGATGIWNVEEASEQHGTDEVLMKNLCKYFPREQVSQLLDMKGHRFLQCKIFIRL